MANYFTDNNDLIFHLNHPMMKKIVMLLEGEFSESKQYDYAPIDHEDALDNYNRILEICGEVSGNIIEPNAKAVDLEGPTLEDNSVIYAKGTQENYDAVVNGGLLGVSISREYGGLNFPIVPYVMMAEVISRADAGFANIFGLQDCAVTIEEFGDDDIKKEYLPRFCNGATGAMSLTEPDAGSDLQVVQLKATFDEKENTWYLNGVKRFITNGDADISLVLARSEEDTMDGRGLSMFIYDRKAKAVSVRRIENKLGIKGSPTCELVFKNAPAKLVGIRRFGLIKYVMSLMNAARLGIGAQSVGISEAAYREALKYANERTQFGKTIDQFPAVYEMLSMMKAKLKAVRSLLYETAIYVDVYKAYLKLEKKRKLEADEKEDMKKYQKLGDLFTPLLKFVASEYSNQITYDSLQIHGGTGYMKDFPIERLSRDARITSIYEGTSQLQVVAAIRGVSTGLYHDQISDFDSFKIGPELEYLKKNLRSMTAQFEKSVAIVQEVNDNEYWDFHARRLIEMIGNIIMGYLLIINAQRDDDHKKSAEIFIRKALSENTERAHYIKNSDLKTLGLFKQ